MILESAHKRIRQATLLTLASVATLVGQSGSWAPSGRMTTDSRIEQKASPVVKKAPLPSAEQSPKKTKDTTQNSQATSEICIPWMPELKFSNKFSSFPVPKVVFPKTSDPDYVPYRAAQRLQAQIDISRTVFPYIPDLFYEKSKLPYAERMKFYESPEKKEIVDALKKQFTSVLGASLERDLLWQCDDLLIFGMPALSLKEKASSFRKAVELCGLTQYGKWMDIQKAKNREFKHIVPEGYDEKEALRQKKHWNHFLGVYGWDEYAKAIGEMPEKPVSLSLPYFCDEDFSHLTPAKKKELLELLNILPLPFSHAPGIDTTTTYKVYMILKADKTGYRYIQEKRPALSRAEAAKLQKLSMEMVIYRRPLALLHAENYTLEQVMQVCKFGHAEIFYEMQQKGKKKVGEISEFGFVMGNLQAKVLMHLGKKYNHPDWVEFGQEMYDAYQKRIVVKEKRPLKHQVIKIEKTVGKHDDTPVIQHQTAPKSDQSSVSNQ